MVKKVEETVSFLRGYVNNDPEILLILGSGLGNFAKIVENKTEISYNEIPNFPVSTVEGHEGKLIFGKLGKTHIVIMNGRFHYYEGYSLKQVVFPIYVLNSLGSKTLIVTNAAGGINRDFKPADLMIIKDHINLLGDNPLIGQKQLCKRFIDMTNAYNSNLIKLTKNVAKQKGISIKEGVYACLSGPSYETPAEINMLSIIGADAVGMSTVPEVIAARHCSMDVLGISCITNMAAGISDNLLSHEEVMQNAKKQEKI